MLFVKLLYYICSFFGVSIFYFNNNHQMICSKSFADLLGLKGNKITWEQLYNHIVNVEQLLIFVSNYDITCDIILANKQVLRTVRLKKRIYICIGISDLYQQIEINEKTPYHKILNNLPYPINYRSNTCSFSNQNYLKLIEEQSNKLLNSYSNIKTIRLENGELTYGLFTENQQSVYKNLLENLPLAVAIYDSYQHLVFYNQAFSVMWCLDEIWLDTRPKYEDILIKLGAYKKLPDIYNFLSQQIDLFTNLRETYNDFWHLPSGRSLHVMIMPHTMGGILYLYEDITSRLTLEKSFEMATKVYQTTLENLTDAMALYQPNGQIILYNQQYLKTWNLEANFLNNNPHISDVLEFSRNQYKSDCDWEHIKIEESIIDKSQQKIIITDDNKFLLKIITILPDKSSLLTYQNITDSKLLEKSLREHNKLLESVNDLRREFITNVAYELRSPLTSIIGFTEMLLAREFIDEYLGNILSSSYLLQDMIDDMLEIASLDINGQDFSPTPIRKLVEQLPGCFAKEILHINCDIRHVIKIINKIKLIAQDISQKTTYEIMIDKDWVLLKITLKTSPKNFSKYFSVYDHNPKSINLIIVERLLQWYKGSLKIEYDQEIIIMMIKLPIIEMTTCLAF